MDENTPEEPEVPPLEIEVRRPALMSRIVVFLVVFAAAFGATSLFELASRAMRGLPFERLIEPLATAVFWFVIGGVTLSWRLYVRSRPLNPIKFNPDHVMMPRAADALGYLKVAYDDILALRLVERGNGVLIALIETRSHVFLFPRDVFVIDNGPQTLLGALHLKIRDRPEGLSVLARMERRRSLAHKISARRPIATQALLGVLAVFTVNQLITGEGLSDSPYELAAWGGTVYPLVLSGEIWRLLSAAFLHQGLGHAIFAGLAVFYAGSMVERILGWERAILIFLVSAFASQLGELILQPVMPVVGASGGALGLLGALGHLNWRFHTQLPLGFRQPKRWWVTVAISVALLSMVWPWVSFFGHLAGALAGFGVSWLLVGRHRGEIAGISKPPVYMSGIVALSILIFGLSLGYAVHSASQPSEELSFEREFVRKALSAESPDHFGYNALSWFLAIDERSSETELNLAKSSSERALALAPGNLSYMDTLATVHYRLGELDEALLLQRKVLSKMPGPVFASQILRFLERRLEERGAVKEIDIQVINPQSAKPELQLTAHFFNDAAHEVFVVVERGGRSLGLLRILIPSNQTQTISRSLLALGLDPTEAQSIALQAAWAVEAVGTEDSAKPVWDYWPGLFSIMALP